ncbi:MAG: C40 family peptidase, partial [Trebonia sp.]
VAVARLAAARRAQEVNGRRLAALAVEDVEAGGGESTGVLMLGGANGPAAYFNAVGLSEVLADRRVDLVEASQADGTVTALFRKQAGELLAQRRKDLATARYLRKAAEAAVDVQLATVAADKTRRGEASAALARAEKAESALAARHHPASASVAGGGPAAGMISPGPSPAWAAGAGASASQGVAAAGWALTQLGKPYRWGGAGPAVYDCSGLVMDAWARAGIKLAHWTGYQWVSGPHVPFGQLRPGDLVFYATNITNAATIHHVGIYIGEGLMVDAPYTGADVRIDSIYQYAGLIGATRPASQLGASMSERTNREQAKNIVMSALPCPSVLRVTCSNGGHPYLHALRQDVRTEA